MPDWSVNMTSSPTNPRANADANPEPINSPAPHRTARLRAFPWRLSLLLAALFAALTLLTGGTGLALGALASIGEHAHHHGLMKHKADDDAGITGGNGQDDPQR
jgi:hypothetical protein